MTGETIQVLIVEDNPSDIYLLKESFRAAAKCEFVILTSGDRAYEYLERAAQAPDIAVIDLNLPGREGVEILDLVRSAPALQQITVAIVSSSPRDLIETKISRADCYITKPMDLDAFMAVGKQILDCYLKTRRHTRRSSVC